MNVNYIIFYDLAVLAAAMAMCLQLLLYLKPKQVQVSSST
jgi:hypothetical protein